MYVKWFNQPKGLMVLIEYDEDTTGLENFIFEMNKRNIQGILMVEPTYVEQHCDKINKLLMYNNIEIAGSYIQDVFWEMPYDEQKQKIINIQNKIEACTNQPIKIISSRYMASDMNTIQIADELNIPYVIGRGTTGIKASVYQVSDYDVKVLSVSNIEDVRFEYGSMCDYSFFMRAGTPEDMQDTLQQAIKHDKITPVSHTSIGGNLEPWYNMWINFWNNKRVKWVSLDEFMSEIDYTLPLWQIPINRNAPYTSEKIKPIVSYEDEQKVGYICPVCI